MSEFKGWKTNFTQHALLRLRERALMAPELLGSILDNEEVISLGTEVDSNRDSRLFFSVADDKFFIAVQDMKTGYVVTILTIEYWHNLSEKHFLEKRAVNKGELLKAVTISDPDNALNNHPPILGAKRVNFSLGIIQQQDGFPLPIRIINGGALDIKLFLTNASDEVASSLKATFQGKMKNKDISSAYSLLINWGMGNELKLNGIEFHGEIDYLVLVNSVKNDIYLRNSLSEKYDDFLEILNRQKKIIGGSGAGI